MQSSSRGSPTNVEPLRVLVVDDSAYVRFAVARYLDAIPDIHVAGFAVDGRSALAQIEELEPDVVTLDVEMPGMDGISALREIMLRYPRPVLMLSSRTKDGAVETIRALSLGAVDFIAKPDSRANIGVVMDELVVKLRACRAVNMTSRSRSLGTRPLGEPDARSQTRPMTRTDKLVLIGTSTGGPRALSEVIPALPGDLPAAVLVVQHMPEGFTGPLATRLDRMSTLAVREASDGDDVRCGQVLIAPAGRHMQVEPGGRVALNEKPSVHGVRPAADVTMTSAVPIYGNRCVGVVLTGMGRDGSNGAALIHGSGGWVIAEDQTTCVVWGMPRSAVEYGAADEVVALPDVAAAIERAVRRCV